MFFSLVNWLRKLSVNIRRGIVYLAQYNRLELFPLVKALRGYGGAEARRDIKAGINVALLALPQGMAYAYIAGLPIHYGIYGSALATLVGPIFSGTRFIMLGPTNATAVLLFTSFMAFNITQAEKLALMPLLVLMIGLFLVVGAFFRVANFIQYVSRTVVTGYITAAALFIVVNQIRKIFGVDFAIPEGTTFFGLLGLTIESLPGFHGPSVILALATACAFVFLQKKFHALPNVAICMVLGSLLAIGLVIAAHQFTALSNWRFDEVLMLAAIDVKTWSLTLPPLDAAWISQLAGTALIIAFLCILEGTSIGKSLAAQSGQRLDANQEMFGMGMANIACAFFSGMPASGSLSRSKLNAASGAAATGLASLLCGAVCAVVAITLGSFTRFIPQPVLGVLVIAIGLSLLSRFHIRIAIKTTRSDAIVFATTFLAALFIKLEFGIILGIATSIILFLNKAAVPELVEYTAGESGQLTPLGEESKRPDLKVSIVHVEGALFFGAAELFRDQMRRVVEDPNLKIVVLKMRNAHHLDATSVLALMELVESMRRHDRHLLVSEARKPVIRVFKNSGLIEVIGRENIFADAAQNPTLSTAKALRRAKDILGGEEAEVSIYVGERKKSNETVGSDS